VGAFIMAASVVVFVLNVALSLRRGEPAGDNPWNAWTLEWATTSPPSPHNFERVPPVRSRRPLWDLAHPGSRPEATPKNEAAPPDKSLVAVWSFIVSETTFFVVLILAYVFFNLSTKAAASALDLRTTGAFTACLLASSLTLHLAEKGLSRGKGASFRAWLGVTLLLGIVFMAGQAREYVGLFHAGVTVNSSLFASTFFTLTGFHGLHVTIGLVALTIILGLASQRRQPGSPGSKGDTGEHPQLVPLKTIGLYWHFVDVVWLVVFTIVYLRAK